MRQFNTNADYYACIIESAEKALAANSADTLCRQVTPNISGGHYFWDSGADKIFESPNNLDEALLGLELRKVLEVATENQLREVRRIARIKPIDFDMFGIPMDFGILSSTAIKLAKRNVQLALQVKLEMAKIAAISDGRGLADFLGTHCLINHKYGDEYCSEF